MLYLETAGDAAAEVQHEKREGYDAVKVSNLLPAPAFEAAVRTAKEVGLPVYGHVPRSVGLSGVLSAGMRSIEHLTVTWRLSKQRILLSKVLRSLRRMHGWPSTWT